MRLFLHLERPLLMLCYALLAGCNVYVSDDTSPDNGDELEVASYQQPCPVPSEGLCRLERWSGSNGWQLRNDPIAGFYPEWGKSYRLEVRNGWSGRELVRVISELKDPVGRVYNINYLTLIEGSFSGWSNNNYRFFYQPFVCHALVNCQPLVNMSGSYGAVSLQFRYTGNSFVPLELIWWN